MTKDEQIKDIILVMQLRNKSQDEDLAKLEKLINGDTTKASPLKLKRMGEVEFHMQRFRKRRAKADAKKQAMYEANKKNL